MRIVTYLPALEALGGVELHVLEVSRELAARGHQISLFYERDGNLTDDFRTFCESLTRGTSVLYADSPLIAPPRILRRAIPAIRQRPDIVYVNNITELAWAGTIRAGTRAPIICQSHEVRPFRRISLSLLGAPVHRFVVTSRYMREAWARRGIDPDRIDVIPCGFSPAAYPRGTEESRMRIRESLGLPRDAYVVLYMGRLIPEKGVAVLLDAWRRLALPPDQARLVIVGVPALPDAHVQALQAQTPAGCEWLPARRDVVEVLQACDVLALPSMWDEPFGRVILEAMATGRPAVASAVGGIPEILEGEFSRMLFPRGDAAALADRLDGLRDWRREDPDLERRCAEHVAQHFALEATVERLESLFADAMSTEAVTR